MAMEETRDQPVDRGEAPLEVRARKRVRARHEFVVHLAIFLVANIGVFAIWKISGARYPWFLWVLVGWGIGLVGHGLTLFFGPESPGEERAVEREMNRLRPRHQSR